MSRLDAIRRRLAQLPDSAEALNALDAAEDELRRGAQTEQRLQALTDSLSAIAALDFSSPPSVRGDGTLIDAAAGCVSMLAEELKARLDERDQIERVLESRVLSRTVELSEANEHLIKEIEEHRRTEAALRDREAQLIQASKLAGVGQLAAGVAHEINNPLAVILGFAQGLERRIKTDAPQYTLPVQSIVREALRCKNLVAQLLTFARTGKRVREPVDVGSVLESAATLLRSRARTQQTEIALDVAAQLPQVDGNRTQLEQVIINLGVNALDALKSGGEVRLRAALKDAGHITLEVTDNGPGIPADVRAHIFEPFFTTKEVGRGTGLGLSLSHEIVTQHGGTLDVDSTVGTGTTMRVALPAMMALNP